MRFYLSFYCCLFLFISISIISSSKDFDEDFYRKNLQTKVYAIDTEASAVVLYESISTLITFENNIYTKKETVHNIIKILKQDAVSAGNVHIFYPVVTYRNYVDNIKAATYNLSGDKIETSLVNKADLLKKEERENVYSMNFFMPAVREGSIIDYSYDVFSNFTRPEMTWHMQEAFPKLVSEYCVIYPKDFEYTTISLVHCTSKEYSSVEDAEQGVDSFAFVKRATSQGEESFWVRRNIDGIKKEPFVVNTANHLERLQLQMTGQKGYFGLQHFNNSWQKINEEIWKKNELERTIDGGNRFLDDVIDSLVKPDMSELDKTKAIFRYVRSHFKRVSNNLSFSKLDIKDAYKYREGNTSQLNILLTAMLVHAGIHAAPLLISTTDNISPNKVFPVLDRMNYMACIVTIDDHYILLDASHKKNCFGLLPLNCYNGYSWILGDKGTGINLTPDLIKNRNVYTVRVYDFGDSTAKLEITQKLGLFQSELFRKTWAEHEEKSKSDTDNLKHSMPENIEILETSIDNEKDPDTNTVIRFTGFFNFNKKTNIFFLNAALISFFEKNPFPATVRKSPIEFPYKTEDVYSMNIMLPKNIEPDSVSKPVEINYKDGAMYYKTNTGYFPDTKNLMVNTSLNINTTTYGMDDYATIREFFQKMIDDENKVLVLKKNVK